jgi:hypothetical protein
MYIPLFWYPPYMLTFNLSYNLWSKSTAYTDYQSIQASRPGSDTPRPFSRSNPSSFWAPCSPPTVFGSQIGLVEAILPIYLFVVPVEKFDVGGSADGRVGSRAGIWAAWNLYSVKYNRYNKVINKFQYFSYMDFSVIT